MRTETKWGISGMVVAAFFVNANALAFVGDGVVKQGARIDDYVGLPGTPPQPRPLFQHEATMSPGAEAESLKFSFADPQMLDTAYAMVLDPAPTVFVGTGGAASVRPGVSWQLLDSGPGENKMIIFDFAPGSHFMPGEQLHFSFWYRGRFGEGAQVTLNSEFSIVPTPGSAVLAALGILGAVGMRNRRR